MNGADEGKDKHYMRNQGRVLVRDLCHNHEFVPKLAEFVLEFWCHIANIQLARLSQQMAKYFRREGIRIEA